MYALAAAEERRYQVQILHQADPCCFRAEGRHDKLVAYNKAVQSATGVRGWMQTAVSSGNFHEVNLRDKVITSWLIERLRATGGALAPEDFARLPFDMLR